MFRKKFSECGAFTKNSLFLFVGSMVVGILNYIFHLVIGRQVSVSVYGEAEALISLIAIISVPAATLTMVATKYVAACKVENNKKGSKNILSYLNKKMFKYGIPVFALAVIATPIIGKALNIQNSFALVLIWLSMFLSFFAAINSGVLRGWQKFKDISLSGVWGTIAKLVFGIVFVNAGFALNGIIGGFVLGTLVSYVATIFFLKFINSKKEEYGKLDCDNLVDFKSLKKFILPVFVGNLAIAILSNADMVLAKHNLDALSAGQYGALTIVSKIIFFGTGVLASVLFAMSAENSHKGDSSLHILKTALALVLVASGGATIIYFLYPTLILSLLFGDKYASSSQFLGWLAISVSLFSLANVIFQYLLSRHKTKISYVLLTISIFMSLLIGIFGKTIGTIIPIVIVFQAVSVGIGVYFLLKLRKKK